MKTLIIGAGPLGSLYTYLLHQAGKEVTLLARGDHYRFLKEKGLVLLNEYSQEQVTEPVKVTNHLAPDDHYDLVIVIMRKNSVIPLLPALSKHPGKHDLLFLGNNASGFDEYLKHFPRERVLFGFPGGGGSRIDHVVHYVDSESPGGKRMPLTLGEIDGQVTERTRRIAQLFESSAVPVRIVDDIDSWLKYHVAFVLPLGGALLQSGDNYRLAKDKATLRTYVLAVREARQVLRSIGYKKSYNFKFKLLSWLPMGILSGILNKVFDSKFAEVAMMMHLRVARDEMAELAREFNALIRQSHRQTPNLDDLLGAIRPEEVAQEEPQALVV